MNMNMNMNVANNFNVGYSPMQQPTLQQVPPYNQQQFPQFQQFQQYQQFPQQNVPFPQQQFAQQQYPQPYTQHLPLPPPIPPQQSLLPQQLYPQQQRQFQQFNPQSLAANAMTPSTLAGNPLSISSNDGGKKAPMPRSLDIFSEQEFVNKQAETRKQLPSWLREALEEKMKSKRDDKGIVFKCLCAKCPLLHRPFLLIKFSDSWSGHQKDTLRR